MRLAARVTTVAALMLLMAGGGVFFTSRIRNEKDYDFGGITCTEVRAYLPQMMAGKLDQESMMRIQKHLELCPNCKRLADQMHDQMPQMQKDMKMGHDDSHDPNCPCGRHQRLLADRDGAFVREIADPSIWQRSDRRGKFRLHPIHDSE